MLRVSCLCKSKTCWVPQGCHYAQTRFPHALCLQFSQVAVVVPQEGTKIANINKNLLQQ